MTMKRGGNINASGSSGDAAKRCKYMLNPVWGCLKGSERILKLVISIDMADQPL
jgi:hypothetical protein